MKRLAALALLAATLPLGGGARADTPPNGWDVAKDPSLRRAWEVHQRARELLTVAEEIKDEEGNPTTEYELALRELERANAASSTSATLKLDLAEALYGLKRYKEALSVLKPALDAEPGDKRAWLTYAFASAYVEDSTEERRAYEKFLSLETDPARRLVPMLNMAEADMRLGDLDEAVRGYKDVLATASSVSNTTGTIETSKLAQWGLTVALDRSGDVYAASKAALTATQWDPPPRDTGSYADASRIQPIHPAHTYAIGDLVTPVPPNGAFYVCTFPGVTPAVGTFEAPHLPATWRIGSAVFRPAGAHVTSTILEPVRVFFVPPYERNFYLAMGETALARDASDPKKSLTHWRGAMKLWTQYITEGKPRGDRWIPLAQRHLDAAKKKASELMESVKKSPPKVSEAEVF